MFLGTIHSLTTHSLIKINKISIELRTFHARKAHLSSDSHAACATHTGTIYHESIKADDDWKIEFPASQRSELHHDHRSDGNCLIIYFSIFIHKFLEHGSHQALESF